MRGTLLDDFHRFDWCGGRLVKGHSVRAIAEKLASKLRAYDRSSPDRSLLKVFDKVGRLRLRETIRH